MKYLIILLALMTFKAEAQTIRQKTQLIISNNFTVTIHDIQITQINGTATHLFSHIDGLASNYTFLPAGGYEIRCVIQGDLYTDYFDLGKNTLRYDIE